MGEENNIFGERKIGFMFEGKFCELGGIVKDSIKWEAEEDDVNPILIPTSYSFQSDILYTEQGEVIYRKPKCLVVADGLYEDLQKLIKAFCNPKIAMSRRERRAKKRKLVKKYKRFVAYCMEHDITIG